MSLWELAGGTLTVTPTVATELSGNVRGSEIRRWRRALAPARGRNSRYDQATYNRILDAVGDAAVAWVRAELATPGGITAAPRDPEREAEAARIARAIPAACFRQDYRDRQRNDRDIIAEAAILGFTVLATENLASIRHDETNAWLQEEGLSTRPLLVRVDDALAALAPDQRPQETALAAVLGAALPDTRRGFEEERTTVRRFIDNLKTSHARRCGVWAADRLEIAEDVPGLIARARRRLPAQSRAAEDRRRAETVRAAEQAGYVRD
ncbi:MAG: hypothetical protein OXF27_12965 [Acidobacteria bacterium]|nr:hypothetical protein [Acidobacteriota bacterium]